MHQVGKKKTVLTMDVLLFRFILVIIVTWDPNTIKNTVEVSDVQPVITLHPPFTRVWGGPMMDWCNR